jgi:hypothetical protein
MMMTPSPFLFFVSFRRRCFVRETKKFRVAVFSFLPPLRGKWRPVNVGPGVPSPTPAGNGLTVLEHGTRIGCVYKARKKKGKIQQTNKAIRKNQGTKRYLANKQEISQTNSRGLTSVEDRINRNPISKHPKDI